MFTDDDLNSLKNRIVRNNCPSELHNFPSVELLALLARLEAAEILLESFLTIIPSQDRSVSMDREEEAWRKVAGK